MYPQNSIMSKKTILFFCFFFLLAKGWTQETTASAQVSTFSIPSPELQITKKIWLYLPKNYSASKKKYSVIYMPDAQNLFDAKTAYSGEWNIDEKLDSLNAQIIVVGIEHGNEKRLEELTPYLHEKYGGGKANQYLDFIVNTLKPSIDKKYRTKTDKTHTLIIGSSLGGLTAFYTTLKYPEVFGKAGVFSPAFWINRKDIIALTEQTQKIKAKYYFLCGDKEGDDDSMVKDLNTIENIINTKRCSCKHLNTKTIIKGGQHNEKLWRDGFVKALLWLGY
ncbi:alpha-glucosidase [Flavobacterium succinicans]|uniref:Alpha-glucosidase n=2 Tax=Flavobacterium succinicans TaxID=29536 RepID=A0A1I4ZRQ6_9FLAO|nr:alpha-glucosidase [Flavobacterium succinicans]